MKRVLACCTISIVLLHPGMQAASQEVKVDSYDARGIVIQDASRVEQRTAGIPRRRDGRRWYRYRLLVGDGNGDYCYATKWTTNQWLATVAPAIQPDLQNVLAPALVRPDCPRTPRAERAKTIAEEAWRIRKELNSPTLKVEPPFGVTGKPSFLTIGANSTDDFEIWNPIDEEMVYIEASSVYEVDWGDRFNTESSRIVTESQGGPWPTGDIRHIYTTADDGVKIRVRQRWTAIWFAGDEVGWLDDLVTEGSIDDYRVIGIEAIRTR